MSSRLRISRNKEGEPVVTFTFTSYRDLYQFGYQLIDGPRWSAMHGYHIWRYLKRRFGQAGFSRLAGRS